MEDMPRNFSFSIHAGEEGEKRLFTVDGPEGRKTYRLAGVGQQDYLDFFASLADDFGTRLPLNRRAAPSPAIGVPCRALLDRNISPDILYGYGDPAILWVPEEHAWYLVVTSNDAPDSFPILRSADLQDWQPAGFAFPSGRKPSWAADGADISDYWAPELHRRGDHYLLCFAARERDGSLSIGIARSDRPEGPFETAAEPLLRGGVIDPHILVGADGDAFLFWKEDSNAVWPRMLARLVGGQEGLIGRLFASESDRRTAGVTAALWGWAETLPPMEQFFILQPLIEAVVADFLGVRERLGRLVTADADQILKAMRTPVYGQRLSRDSFGLIGEPAIVLVNDLEWEGHLIEGPWVTRQQGRYWLFYSGNDFSTAEYGIGAAVADTPLGPYRKLEQPLLRTTINWAGPGHPSIAPGPDGTPQIFFHAFRPGHAGYKEFRALLTARLRFDGDKVEIC